MLKDERINIDEKGDLLGQRAAIETLVAAIGKLPPPACIAQYGPWGSGKTNILHNAEIRAKNALHVTVWFDPWPYDQAPDLVGPMIKALLAKARSYRKGHPERWAQFRSKARRFGRAAGRIIARAAMRKGLNLLAVDAVPEVLFGDGEDNDGVLMCRPEPLPDGTPQADLVAAADMAEIDRWLDDEQDPHDAVAAVRRRFAELVKATLALAAEDGVPGPDARVVFFLDDLDRCLPDRTVELIEKIKLLLCGEEGCRAIFVFALDRRIVGEAIRHRFPGASQYSGENYLEKIFDLSLETPPVPGDRAAVAAVVECFAEPLGGLEKLCAPFGTPDPLITALAVPALANPRVIKRTLNRLSLLLSDRQRRDQIAAIGEGPAMARLLTWLAGAERFRSFRHFLCTAQLEEAAWLVSAVAGRRALPPGEPGRLALLPGLGGYLNAAGLLEENGVHGLRPFTQGRNDPPPRHSLKWFDDLMRAAGL